MLIAEPIRHVRMLYVEIIPMRTTYLVIRHIVKWSSNMNQSN